MSPTARRAPARLKLDSVLADRLNHLVDRPECPFCGHHLRDLGSSFVSHVERHGACRAGWEAWKQHISEDWHGGD